MVAEYAAAAIALFVFGAIASWIAIIRLAIYRERKEFTVSAPDRVTRGVRVVNGLHVRRPAGFHEPAYYRHDLPPLSDEERQWPR
jgi:hypothetical protein